MKKKRSIKMNNNFHSFSTEIFSSELVLKLSAVESSGVSSMRSPLNCLLSLKQLPVKHNIFVRTPDINLTKNWGIRIFVLRQAANMC